MCAGQCRVEATTPPPGSTLPLVPLKGEGSAQGLRPKTSMRLGYAVQSFDPPILQAKDEEALGFVIDEMLLEAHLLSVLATIIHESHHALTSQRKRLRKGVDALMTAVERSEGGIYDPFGDVANLEPQEPMSPTRLLGTTSKSMLL